MRIRKSFRLLMCSMIFTLSVLAVLFVFNPLGLGPEPATVLPRDFFAKPAPDLSGLELLIDGEEAFDRVLKVIDSARSSIFIQMFIWKDDRIGKRVADRLKQAARRGVKVTISKDLLGTFFELGDMIQGRPSPVFTSAGLKGYENIHRITDWLADNDHSKYFIVDKRLVVFGGMNIADEYHTQWHDYMALIDSRLWTEAFERKVSECSSWPNPAPFVVAVNDRKATEIRTALTEMIDSAAERVIIEHAYFSDDKVIDAVIRAGRRGVRVDIILPKTPDTHLYANRVTVNRLLASGLEDFIRIFFYPQMTHAKVILTDGKIAALGSANLTPRSMLTSREITLFVHGTGSEPFIRELRDRLHADIAESEEVTHPFRLSATDKIMALTGKYIW